MGYPLRRMHHAKLPPAKLFVQIAVFMALLFAVQLVNFIGGMWLSRFGVLPRTIVGLRGILFSPLLHVNWSHLLANAAPLAGLLAIMAVTHPKTLWANTAAIWIMSGIGVWIFGRPGGMQIGASGVIYGLAAFLITVGWLKKDAVSALAALLVVALYGGIVWGVLPNRTGVSWEGHLCGAIAGVLAANLPGKYLQLPF